MSDALDRHLDEAFASLDALTMREVEATAAALERRRDALGRFSGVFSDVAFARESGEEPDRFQLRQAVEHGGDELAERIADAEAPFWGHVRDALALVPGDD